MPQTVIPVRTLKEIAFELITTNYVLLTSHNTLYVQASYNSQLETIAKEYNLTLLQSVDSSSKLFVTGEFKLK